MTIRIICNGKVSDTRIIHVESGTELQNECTRAEITLDAGDKGNRPRVTLHFTDVAFEVVAESIKTHPPIYGLIGE